MHTLHTFRLQMMKPKGKEWDLTKSTCIHHECNILKAEKRLTWDQRDRVHSVAGNLWTSSDRRNDRVKESIVKSREDDEEEEEEEELYLASPSLLSRVLSLCFVYTQLFIARVPIPVDVLMSIPPDIKENSSEIDLSRVCSGPRIGAHGEEWHAQQYGVSGQRRAARISWGEALSS